MNVIEDPKGFQPDYVVITGDGRTELHLMRVLPRKYNGVNLILFFPHIKRKRPKQTGLNELDVLKFYPGKYKILSFIYIVDGDTFPEGSADTKIQDYLRSIGININDITPIQDAYLIKCSFGPYNITLYCIILGPEIFIEEEIAVLIKLKLGVEIDLSGRRNIEWKVQVKKKINQILKANNVNLEHLIKETSKGKLEEAFPNLCAVFKKIEEEYENSL